MEGFERNKGRESRDIDPGYKTVKLVDRATMSERLCAINDEPEYQRIYAYFERIAGTELPPIAIAGVITLAIDRYTFGDRDNPSSQLLRMFVPHFVDAIVEDDAARQAVKEVLGER